MTSKIEKRQWKNELCAYMRNYRCTLHSTTEQAPADLFFVKRNLCTRLPELRVNETGDSVLRETDKRNKAKIKKYADVKICAPKCTITIGESVLVKRESRRKSDPYYDHVPFVVTKGKGNQLTAERKGHRITRNLRHFKKVPRASYDYSSGTHMTI